MLEQDYAKAVTRAMDNGATDAQAFNRLHALLKRRGHMRLLPKIHRHLQLLVYKRSRHASPTVRVARDTDQKKLKKDIDTACDTLSISKPAVVVDDQIIGGYVVEGNGQLFDASYKAKLLQLYRSFIS